MKVIRTGRELDMSLYPTVDTNLAHQSGLDPLELHDEHEGDFAADVVDARDVVDEEPGEHVLHALHLRPVVRAVVGGEAERRHWRAIGLLHSGMKGRKITLDQRL